MTSNDQLSEHDVLRAVSDSLSNVPLSGPAHPETVMARGRTRQRRRRACGMTAALAAAIAVVTVTVAALPTGGHPAPTSARTATSPAPSDRLAAWTVIMQTDGDIHITISELSDPAGLQSTLRTDGVLASVTFLGQPNPACRPLGADPGLLGKIFPGHPSGTVHHLPRGVNLATGVPAGADMVIDPTAIPSGVGLQLAFRTINGTTPGNPLIAGHTNLVHASQQCTGN
jgi:hypothetical protein